MTEVIYLLFPISYAVLNAASFTLYGMDKFKAKNAAGVHLLLVLWINL